MAYTEMHILGQVEIMEDGMIGYLYIDIKSIRNESWENCWEIRREQNRFLHGVNLRIL